MNESRVSSMRAWTLGVLVLGGFVTLVPLSGTDAGQQTVSYSSQIKPIFAMRCTGCHGDGWGDQRDQLDLRTYKGLMDARRRRLVYPGKPLASYLLYMVSLPREDGGMPKDSRPLSDEEIELLRKWIAEGAKEDQDSTEWPELQIDDVLITSDATLRINCQVPVDAYLRVTLWDGWGRLLKEMGATIRSERELNDAGKPAEFVTWRVRGLEDWPKRISVRLSVMYSQGDPSGTVFIISYPINGSEDYDEKLPKNLLSFVPDPARPPITKQGEFTFWLKRDSDVALQILPEHSKKILYQSQQRDLAKGVNRYLWDLKTQTGQWVPRGRYVGRFRCSSRAQGTPQYDFAIMFKVDPQT